MGLALAVDRIFDLIMIILLFKVFFSWLPNINWYNEPFLTLHKFSELFFGPFRKVIPPIGMIDVSPVVAFIALTVVQKVLFALLSSLGL